MTKKSNGGVGWLDFWQFSKHEFAKSQKISNRGWRFGATEVALLCNSDNLVTQAALKLFKPVKLPTEVGDKERRQSLFFIN